jgi:RHS repeat-associated protein
VRYLTDTNGIKTDSYDYDAFGILIAAAGNTPNLYLYAGEQIDPDLGMYFLRARYLNQEKGRFWNQDTYEGNNEEPLSLHKYLYTHDDPVNNVDPSGFYEIDVHQFLTEYLARAAGFRSKPEAFRIGDMSQAADAPGSKKDAMYGGVNHDNMSKYHFVTKERLERLRNRIYRHGLRDFEYIGDYFHALEDTYSHTTGAKDRNWYYYHAELPIIGNIGHGYQGHTPDWTWKKPAKALKMAEMVYNELRLFAVHTGQNNPVQSWSDIVETVEKFINFTPRTYYERMYGRAVETVTFEGYQEKIKILDPSFNMDSRYDSIYGNAARRNSLVRKVSGLQTGIPFQGGMISLGF